MKNKKFNIYDYVHNTKFSIHENAPIGSRVAKGYNDIRKTNINSIVVKNGKFSLRESLSANKPMVIGAKKHFIEILNKHNDLYAHSQKDSNVIRLAESLGKLINSAKQVSLSEASQYSSFSNKTKLNELQALKNSLDSLANDARLLDEQMRRLYQRVGDILSKDI